MNNKIACTTGGYQGQGLDRVFLGLSKAGFEYAELTAMPSASPRIPVDGMSEADVRALRDTMASYGLAPASISGHSDLGTEDGRRLFARRLEFAHQIGVDIVNTGAAHGDSAPEVEQFYANMRELVPLAQDLGIKIALETHGGMTGTAEDCLRTLDRIGSDVVGINYDTANVIYYRDVRPEEDIQLIAPRVTHVHLKDKRGGQMVWDFPPLGQGTIDFAAIVGTLTAVGYEGVYSAEVEFEAESAEEEDRLLAGVREFMAALLGS